jgi:transposase
MRIPEDATPRERELYAVIERLEARIAELEAKLAKADRNSSNSSKPPSSDIVRPPKPRPPRGRSGRKRGGQPGHPKHERAAFPPEEVDEVLTYKMKRCPKTGRRLRRADAPPRTIQQVGLAEKPYVVREHRAYGYSCAACGEVHYAPFPKEVECGGLLDSGMTAYVAHLKGACHMSYTTIRKHLAECMGLVVSRGQLAKTVAKASEALAAPCAELEARLPEEPRVNVDETGHKDPERLPAPGAGARPNAWWTWAFRAPLFTLFRIVDSRGSRVLVETLGEQFEGVLGSDCFPAYLKYMRDFNVILQLCLAHLVREVKFLAGHPDAGVAAYGRRFLGALRDVFGVIHRRETMTPRGFRRRLRRAKGAVLKAATRRVPAQRDAAVLAKRMREHGEAYFTFVTTPGVEPTNNLAEQAIRFVVIDRRITQGTRGEPGRRWCERIWTAVATSAQQGRSVYRFLAEARSRALRRLSSAFTPAPASVNGYRL